MINNDVMIHVPSWDKDTENREKMKILVLLSEQLPPNTHARFQNKNSLAFNTRNDNFPISRRSSVASQTCNPRFNWGEKSVRAASKVLISSYWMSWMYRVVEREKREESNNLWRAKKGSVGYLRMGISRDLKLHFLTRTWQCTHLRAIDFDSVRTCPGKNALREKAEMCPRVLRWVMMVCL